MWNFNATELINIFNKDWEKALKLKKISKKSTSAYFWNAVAKV